MHAHEQIGPINGFQIFLPWKAAQTLSRYMSFFETTVPCSIASLDKIDGLVQERRNSIANTLELRLSCINPS